MRISDWSSDVCSSDLVTRGRTADHVAHLADGFLAAMERNYGGTRLGRHELDGELSAEAEGALWGRGLLAWCRVAHVRGTLARVVVEVGPPASRRGHAGGIGVVLMGEVRRQSISAEQGKQL